MLAAVDAHGCDRARLADPDTLRRFASALIDAIGMRAHGPLRLERFGHGDLEGWSAMQFIETSSITIHADEVSCRGSRSRPRSTSGRSTGRGPAGIRPRSRRPATPSP
jgi:hypothetical protein